MTKRGYLAFCGECDQIIAYPECLEDEVENGISRHIEDQGCDEDSIRVIEIAQEVYFNVEKKIKVTLTKEGSK